MEGLDKYYKVSGPFDHRGQRSPSVAMEKLSGWLSGSIHVKYTTDHTSVCGRHPHTTMLGLNRSISKHCPA